MRNNDWQLRIIAIVAGISIVPVVLKDQSSQITNW